MQVKGRIIHIGQTENVTDTFKKRVLVVEVPDGEYPQQIKMEAVQKHVDILDNVKIGDDVTASINLRGIEFVNRNTSQKDWFTSIQVWKVESDF
ncbi:DUF3127 domain-containing protein [bacterium]|nr:DUF3127 domain-containing protein [bacterium]